MFVSGQLPIDDGCRLVGAGDHAAQTERTFRNVATALAAAGATFADVVRLGISALALPGQLIEIEAVAVLP